MSKLDDIITKAFKSSDMSYKYKSDRVEIEVTVDGNYEATKVLKRVMIKSLDSFSVNTGSHLNKIIEEDKTVEDKEYQLFNYGYFLYKLEYFPKPWLEEAWLELFPNDKPEKEESLMDFALRNGCDYMDMNTMTIYSAQNND